PHFVSWGHAAAGTRLTRAGEAPAPNTASGTARIDSVIAGNAGLVKAGGGTLQLGGANTFSGSISLLAGTLHSLSDAALGAAGNDISTAAGTSVGLRIDGGPTARSITIGDGGSLTLSGAGAGSALLSGNGRVNAAAN